MIAVASAAIPQPIYLWEDGKEPTNVVLYIKNKYLVLTKF